MQPSASAPDGTGVKLVKGEATAGRSAPVNEEAWWKKRAEDVPVDEVFFYRFFKRKHELEKEREKKAEKRKGKDGDEEDLESGEEDEEDEEVEDVEESGDEDEESDKEEAEIWKVCSVSRFRIMYQFTELLSRRL